MEPKPEATSRSVLRGGGLAVGLAFTGLFARFSLLVDDAFISFRYAENLAAHGELVHNLGERVEGYSNLFWTLLLALGALAGVAPTTSAPLLGYLASVGTLGLCYVAGRRVLGLEPLAALYACVLVALSLSYTFWAGAGLETALFGLLVLGSWALLCSSWLEHRFGPPALMLLAALVALTRPEGLVLALAVLGAAGGLGRGPRRRWLWPSLGLLALLGAHLLWRHAYYGAWLPNAAAAKLGFTSAALGRGARYLWDFSRQEGWLWLLPLALLAKRRDARYLTLAAVVLGYAAFVVSIGGDGLYRFRLLAHVVPCLALLVAAGLDRLWRERRRWFPVVAGATAVIAVLPLTARAFFREFSLEEVRSWEERWELVGRALGEHTPPGARLATNVIGRVPYYSRQPTLDLLGLTEPVIARQSVEDFGHGYAGHERAAPEYVLAQQPDLVYFSVLDGLPERAFQDLALDAEILGAGSLYRYVPLLHAPGFARDYAPASLRLDDGRQANLFVRTGSPSASSFDDGLQVGTWSDGGDTAILAPP